MIKEILGLDHIALHTLDSERSIRFYKRFGGEILCRDVTYIANKPGFTWKLTMLKIGDFVLELKEPSDPAVMPQSDDGFFNHICLRVSDVEKAVAQLEAAGVDTFIEPKLRQHKIYRPTGVRNAFLRGPDGEQIELLEYGA